MAPYADLREFMEVLRDRGDLMTVDREVNPVFEVTAYTRATSDLEGPAILCPHVEARAEAESFVRALSASDVRR